MARILLLLPCNGGVRLGDYNLGDNWRIVKRWIWDLTGSGIVDVAAVDSCKPGIVYEGEEHDYIWCDIRPLWHELYARQSWRMKRLIEGVKRDLAEAATRYRAIAAYLNVRAYRMAIEAASKSIGVRVHFLGPERLSPLSFRSHRSLEALREGLEKLAASTRTL